MKIIHVLNHFLPQQIAGTEVYTFSLIKHLQQLDIESIVLIPNYDSVSNEEYTFEGIRVTKYAEPSVVDRALIMGKRIPDGLINFIDILRLEQPDIVQFHELAGSNGITLSHIVEAKLLGFKTIMTFHLASNTCKTGNVMYKDQVLCDGRIDIKKCSFCNYKIKKLSVFNANLLYIASVIANSFKYDTTQINNSLGTAIGFPNLIKQLKTNLEILIANCDQLVVLTKWYKTILERNEVTKEKIKYIPQGLPLKKKHNILFESSPNDDKLKVMFLGRISAFKGIDLLLDAVLQLQPNKISLSIYGKDNDDDYAKVCKQKTLFNKNISWKGPLLPESVVETMMQYDILCLPSTFSEMSPLVIQEAYAAGIPVIASNVYGNAEQIIDGVNGWLFKFKDSNDLKDKLQLLIDNPKEIENAKKNIPQVRLFDEVAKEYYLMYSSL